MRERIPGSMEFIARLPSNLDQAMTLFQMRRLGATGEYATAAGASDVQLRGEVPDDRFDDLVAAFSQYQGAIHAGDRHIALTGGSHTKHDSIAEAEAHLGGPFTMPGTTRATWAYGGDVADHIVQILYQSEEHLGTKSVVEATGRRPEEVMKSLKHLIEDGVVRRFRAQGDISASAEQYGLARTVRDKIDGVLMRSQMAGS